MKRIYVNEKWCLACHLCEYNCAFANSNEKDIVFALKDLKINPRIRVEEKNGTCFSVSCRNCKEPLCVKSCITGALSKNEDGLISVNKEKCIHCYTCIVSCPYGAIMQGDDKVVQKCELCTNNQSNTPKCVEGCPNNAIVFEERGE